MFCCKVFFIFGYVSSFKSGKVVLYVVVFIENLVMFCGEFFFCK